MKNAGTRQVMTCCARYSSTACRPLFRASNIMLDVIITTSFQFILK
jgi:hypothetical protein